MPRIPKRVLALSGVAAGAVVVLRRRRARPDTPAPAAAPAPSAPAPAVAAQPPVAPPPPETPGPSVTPPGQGTGLGSETERAERAEATTPDSEVLRGRPAPPDDDDELVAQEEAAAAAEAAAIGGPGVDDAHGDPAFEAVYEAGGGEAEGFEAAEDELIENASHGGGRAEPISDAFTPEREADEATAVDGEADAERVSEIEPDEDDR